MKKLRIGIIGCGTIGKELAFACGKRLKESVVLAAICDSDPVKVETLKKALKGKVKVLQAGRLIKECDFVIEAASASVSADIVKKCISAKKDCLIMSVGGLLGNERLLKLAEARSARIYIPSGAVSGVDGLKSASVGRIDSVILTTRKPPGALAGAPYIKARSIEMDSIKEDTVIFDGTAGEAVKGFPQNINVSAVLSLAGIGAKKTGVRIVASPGSSANIHEIEISGEFGRMRTITENVPSAANPKTSALAIFSAIATLESAVSSVRIGT